MLLSLYLFIYIFGTLCNSLFLLWGSKLICRKSGIMGFGSWWKNTAAAICFLFWKDGEEEDPWMKIVLISQEAPINHLYTLRYTLGSENIPPEKQMRSYGSLGIISYYLFFHFIYLILPLFSFLETIFETNKFTRYIDRFRFIAIWKIYYMDTNISLWTYKCISISQSA